MTRAAIGLALSFLCLAPAGHAAAGTWINPYTGSTWNNPVSSHLDTMLRGRALRESMERAQGERGKAAPEAGRSPARLTYRPSPTRTAQEFAASLFRAPGDRAEMTRFLEAALASYRGDAEKAGRKNDVAFALAYFVAGNHAIHAEESVSDEAIAAVARQLDGALAGMPGLRRASDGQRQGFAEQLVCSTAFVLAGYQQAVEKKDDRQKQAFRALAAAFLERTMGVAAGRLSVTDAGLAVR